MTDTFSNWPVLKCPPVDGFDLPDDTEDQGRGSIHFLGLDVPVMTAELERTFGLIQAGSLRQRPWYCTLPEELLQLRHVTLSGDGEPTLAPNFAETVEAVFHVRRLGDGRFSRSYW